MLEKQGLDRLGALAIVTNAVLYGVAKAEIDLAGKPSVYSRTAIDRAVDFFLSSLKDHGISLRPAYSALEAVQGYMRTLTAAGLLEPSQFNVGGSGSEIEVETWDCPYGQAGLQGSHVGRIRGLCVYPWRNLSRCHSGELRTPQSLSSKASSRRCLSRLHKSVLTVPASQGAA